MALVNLTIRNISVLVHTEDYKIKNLLDGFFAKLTTYKTIKVRRGHRFVNTTVVDRVYIGNIRAKNIFVMPVILTNALIAFLSARGLKKEDFNIDYDKNFKTSSLNVKLKFEPDERDYQLKYIKDLKDPKRKITLIDLQTGKGKTLIATKALSEYNKKIFVLIPARYMDKWKADLTQTYFEMDSDELFVLSGKDSFDKLKKDLDNGKEYKIILASSRTMYMFLDAYENSYGDLDFDYPFNPISFMRDLKFDTILIDEAHEEFYANYKTSLMLDPNKLVGLSATLIGATKEEDMIYHMLFPKETRLSYLEIDKYIKTRFVDIRIPWRYRIRDKGNYGYSQVAFEKSILRIPMLKSQIFDAIYEYIEKDYLPYTKELKTAKAGIYFGTVKMCTEFTKYLNNKLEKKYKDIKVGRYTSEDPISNVMKKNIFITTYKSAGAALDIPDLIRVYNFELFKSPKQNRQLPGRLRKRKDDNTVYTVFYNSNSKKHNEFKRRMEMILRRISKEITHEIYDKIR